MPKFLRDTSHGSWVLLGTGVTALLSFLFQAILSMTLSDADFGYLSSAMVWGVTGSILMSLGAQNVLLNYVKRQKGNRQDILGVFSHIWMQHMGASALACGLIYVIFPEFGAQIVFIASFAGLLSLFAIIGAGQQAIDHFRGVGTWLILPELAKLFALLVLFIFGVSQPDHIGLLFAVVFLAISLGVFLRCAVPPRRTKTLSYRDVVTTSAPYVLSGVMFMVYHRSPLVVLALVHRPVEAGSLAIIYFFMSALLLLPTAYSQRFLLGRWHSFPLEDFSRFSFELRRQLWKMLLFSLPIGAIIFLFSGDFLQFVYQDRYAAAQTYAPWFASVLVLKSLCIPLQAATSVDDLKWRKTMCICIVAGLTIGAAFLLTPTLGLKGAFLAAVLAESALVVSLAWAAYQRKAGRQIVQTSA